MANIESIKRLLTLLSVTSNRMLNAARCTYKHNTPSAIHYISEWKYTIWSIVCEASCHLVTMSLGHSVIWSLGHLVTWSLSDSVTWSLISTLLLTNKLTHNIRTYRSASQTNITFPHRAPCWQSLDNINLNIFIISDNFWKKVEENLPVGFRLCHADWLTARDGDRFA